MSISQNFPTITPTLNLNFARSKKLDPRITFTRTSSATRTNGQGLIEVVGADTPRFEHSVVGVGSTVTSVQSLGLLIEESRTNLIIQSEAFNTGWLLAGATVGVNSTTAPDGTSNADAALEDGTNGQHTIYRDVTTSPSSTYTASCFIKAGTRTYGEIFINGGGAAGSGTVGGRFDLTNLTVTSTGDLTLQSSSINSYPNGWYRCSITGSVGGSGSVVRYHVRPSTSSTGSYQGVSGDAGIYMWGAQLEAGAFPTSYIPTVASTVTRTGDLAFINLPSTGWYNYSQGSLVFQHSTVPYGTGTSPGYPSVGFAQTDGTSVNAILYFFVKNTGETQYLVRSAGVDQANINPTTPTGASAGKVGFAYTTNSFVLARNGSQVGTDTSGTVPQSIGTLLLGTNEKTVANNLNACISNVIYYPRALSSAQLQNLTK